MIKYIKLKNTEELVSEIEEDGNYCILKYPAKITMKYLADDIPPKTVVLPYIFHSKEYSCKIEKSDILFAIEASDSLIEYYTTNINTNYITKE